MIPAMFVQRVIQPLIDALAEAGDFLPEIYIRLLATLCLVPPLARAESKSKPQHTNTALTTNQLTTKLFQ